MRFLATSLTLGLAAAAGAFGAASAPLAAGGPSAPVARLELEVVATYPHDPGAFTQGLLWHRGRLYESTGMYGRSSLREVELATGRVTRRVDLDPGLFAEGLALAGDRLFQLTYQTEIGWIWHLDDFRKMGDLSYVGEGWGLTYDGKALVQSDGSATLSFRSSSDFSVLRTVQVTRDGRPQFYLNELEYVNGEIWANIWLTDEIVRIDPSTGRITGVVDASGLLSAGDRRNADVLNGIAYDADRQLFLVTGKDWPKLFAIRIRPAATATR